MVVALQKFVIYIPVDYFAKLQLIYGSVPAKGIIISALYEALIRLLIELNKRSYSHPILQYD